MSDEDALKISLDRMCGPINVEEDARRVCVKATLELLDASADKSFKFALRALQTVYEVYVSGFCNGFYSD